MLSIVLIVILALVMFIYLAIPLLVPSYADPLPSTRDPVAEDLEEERDALIHAIRELDNRQDLAQERRDELRARYEAKAARVLRALDEYNASEKGQTRPKAKPTNKRPPVALITLLGLMLFSAAALGGWVLPRTGDTVITVANERLTDAEELAALQRAAERDPSVDTLAALADGYWVRGEDALAQDTYLRTIDAGTAPAIAYRRLGLLSLQTDIDAARLYLEQARQLDPTDLDTLYTLGEVYFAVNRPEDAVDVWQAYLNTPEGADDPEVTSRLVAAETIAPLARGVRENPSEDSLLALADGYWQLDERERAADIYFLLLTEENENNPTALSRLGQVLFFSGRSEDAIGLLARANDLQPNDLPTLLFLGNAYFSLELYEAAIDTWQDYVTAAGGEQAAGRIPSLIEQARAAQNGTEVLPSATLNPANPDAVTNLPTNVPTDVPTDTANAPTSTVTSTVPSGETSTVTSTVPSGETSTVTSTVPTSTVPTSTVPSGEQSEDLMAMGSPSHPGERAYLNNCSGCHGVEGQGGAGNRLSGNDNLLDTDYVVNIIRNGRGLMPAYDATMSDETINNITAYLSEVIYPIED
jgi:tetratricopeptide (TPR) repeat protein/cytochrome c553